MRLEKLGCVCRLDCLVLLLVCWSSCVSTAPSNSRKDRIVYWNATSSVFVQSAARGGFFVPKNDRLVIVCPTSGTEFYKIYWTHSSAAAAKCLVEAPQVFFLLECRHAGSTGAYLVTDFSPIPDAPTFDRPVFLFSPSTGDRSGLEQLSGGACQQKHMRLMVAIGDPDSQPPQPPPQSVDDSPLLSAHQPLPSARQTPPGQVGYQDLAKQDSKKLRLITGSPLGAVPSLRLVAAAAAVAATVVLLLASNSVQ